MLQRAAARSRAQAKRPKPAGNRPAFTEVMAGMQVLADDKIAAEDAAAAERARVEVAHACRKASRVPDRYKDAQLDTAVDLPADAAPRYRAAIKRLSGLVERPALMALIGELGAGKSWMACALINKFTSLGRSARYMEAMDYLLAIRQTWTRQATRTEDQVVNEYVQLSLLVLDEMQVRTESANEEVLLTRLINKRYMAKRATVLISNHESEEQFQADTNGRWADRMFDDGGGIIVCKWPSLRGRIVLPRR